MSAQEQIDAPPIDVGSTWNFTDSDVRYDQFTVTNITVDVDGVPQVTVSYDTGDKETVTAEDVREKAASGAIERTNTGHEAYQRREVLV